MGYLLLEGGSEFGGLMSDPDLRAIDLAGGVEVPICILPTAAAPDKNDKRAGKNGIRWFQSLGAKNVFSVDVIDSDSANDESLAVSIRTASLIYMLGGFPRYLADTLAHSLAWQAVLDAYNQGAVLAGSSAGAMVLCEHYYDPFERRLLRGLNLIPNACVIPHHNSFGKAWTGYLEKVVSGATLIGIDEQTGMINNADGTWQIYGAGAATLYRNGKINHFTRGETFSL